ncbi:MAG: copper amine oxidase N-terminal domain-containing protein [Clostridiales bacterium]|jgi:hypothetical protein|nr:copper amine oxidase N-terminal domain-containing protein [Clostridiales bacterium]
MQLAVLLCIILTLPAMASDKISRNIKLKSSSVSKVAKSEIEGSPDFLHEKKLASREEGVEIKGALPMVYNLSIEVEINERIESVYKQKVASAKESKARTVAFDYNYEESRGVSSIVLYTTTSTATLKQEVDSFNFNAAEGRFVAVNDILHPNGLQLANKIISAEVKGNPDRYYPNFPGLQEDDAFKVVNGDIAFMFDAFQIAPGSEGIMQFNVAIDDVVTIAIRKNSDYWIKEQNYSLKMVPLRSVCTALGYVVGWSSADKKITVGWPGDSTSILISIDKNDYTITKSASLEKAAKRSLEASPELVAGITYVPISFFDQLLDRVAFSVDEYENVIFSSYKG